MTMENEQVVQLQEQLARVEAERDAERARGDAAVGDANEAEAQLAEAVGLLHEFAAAQEAKRQGISNAQRAAGISRLVVVEERVVAFLARHVQAEQQEALSDAELMEVAMFEGSGNKAARRAAALGAAELPEHLAPQQEAQGAQAGDSPADGMEEFLADLARSRGKYPNNARMFDGLLGEVDELRRAYAGDGDVRAEAFDVAVCAFRIATEGDSGGNAALATQSAEWADQLYTQGFDAGAAASKRLNAVRGAEHDQ